MTFEWPDGLPIGEVWTATTDTRDIHFPFDGSVVAQAPEGDAELARRAIDAADAVKRRVARISSYARRAVLRQVHAELADKRSEFENLLVLETGKPLLDCRVEVDRTLLTLETSAEEVARLHGETVPLDLLPSGDGLMGFWQRKPIGVVVGIAGYNYPLLLAAHKVAPAFAAGCPVVVKPAEPTPLATLWLVHLMREALIQHELPLAAVQLVTGDAAVGQALTTDSRVSAVSFTGSAGVGHAIAKAAAPTKVLLELGSNSALVVAEDADVDAAAAAVVRGGYYASGQACISVQRVIVVDSAREAFIDRLRSRIGDVVVGDPRDEATRVSSLIDERSTQRVLDWVEEAVEAGAELAAGGARTERSIQPTILLNVRAGQQIWEEEVFGPVVCVRTVADLDEAFDLVNDSRYGLQASVFTSSLAAAHRAIDELEVGGVVINEVPGFRSDVMPYGGVKDSGIGREGPRFAIEELTVTRMAIIRSSTT
ncbi:aldehyde dehydrogenase family protein [Demetria terragena]|uniref:aldehyde dehydrogenase family protein n=1 Tax=Demetria terragena TaxID=63959 RepID=UPI00036884DF|nr:aldehyde dehydrogenase family protein [Demetria terragena]